MPPVNTPVVPETPALNVPVVPETPALNAPVVPETPVVAATDPVIERPDAAASNI